MRAFVRTILKGWDNVIVEDGGAPLEFNEVNAVSLLTQLPELYEMLLENASDAALFKEATSDDNEELAKNSQGSFNTNLTFPTAAKEPEKAS